MPYMCRVASPPVKCILDSVNVDAIRRVDRFVGTPLCWALTVCRWIARLAGTTSPPPRRVLVIKLTEMGSTVLAYPALRALQKAIPDVEIHFLVFENNRAILDALNMTPPSRIFSVSVKSPLGTLADAWKAVRHLQRLHIDTTLDFDFFSRFSAAFAYLVCRGNRVGFHRYTGEGQDRGNLLTHRVHYSPHIHTSSAFMALVQALLDSFGVRYTKMPETARQSLALHDADRHTTAGMEGEALPCRGNKSPQPVSPADEPLYKGAISESSFILPDYRPPETDIESVRTKLRDRGLVTSSETSLVLINPNSSDLFPLRRWPLDRFAEVTKRLIENDSSVRIVVTGTASEEADARAILDRVSSSSCVSMAGATTFPELLALYSLASLMITNDSGPAHFATLLCLPTLVLFGPETPRLYSPIGPQARCLYPGFACSPCVSVYNAKKSPCRRSLCLESISVDEVLRNATEMLHLSPCGLACPRPFPHI